MLQITIDNPQVESFIRDELNNDESRVNQTLHAYVKWYRIRQETEEARMKIAQGEFVEEEALFEKLLSRYAD